MLGSFSQNLWLLCLESTPGSMLNKHQSPYLSFMVNFQQIHKGINHKNSLSEEKIYWDLQTKDAKYGKIRHFMKVLSLQRESICGNWGLAQLSLCLRLQLNLNLVVENLVCPSGLVAGQHGVFSWQMAVATGTILHASFCIGSDYKW